MHALKYIVLSTKEAIKAYRRRCVGEICLIKIDTDKIDNLSYTKNKKTIGHVFWFLSLPHSPSANTAINASSLPSILAFLSSVQQEEVLSVSVTRGAKDSKAWCF